MADMGKRVIWMKAIGLIAVVVLVIVIAVIAVIKG